MRSKLLLPLTFVILLVSRACFTADPIPSALTDYVKRDDGEFKWKIARHSETENGRILELKVTSQRWHGIIWEHAVEVYEPKNVTFPRHAILFVTGGNQPPRAPDDRSKNTGLSLAKLSGMRVVLLHQVPNQPLFDNRREDDLITETWLKYLRNGDETWPLLFPMVKSAVRTMDAVQALAKRAFDQPIDSFIMTGASKRGWTSWLTPAADSRVIATAPLVIDVLNFRAQMKHQLATWGEYSEQIIDYSSKGLIVEGDETPRERQLRLMMDPYTYRKRLTLPKLLVNGANDPYWVCDAMKLYWFDLEGPRYALNIPNAGHGLRGGRELVFSTVGAFARHIARDKELPKLKWSVEEDDGRFGVSVSSSGEAATGHVWIADSDDLDFRDEKWISRPLKSSDHRSFTGRIPKPTEGHVAFFADLRFEIDGVPFSLCSLIHRK